MKTNGEILNVGSSKNFKVKFIINKINKLIKKGSPQYGQIKLRKDENRIIFADITKSKKLLRRIL